MDSEFGSIDMDSDMRVDAISFTEAVDGAIRSPSNFGASPAHTFASLVDYDIRSDTASKFGLSRVHSFDSIVDCAIRSDTVSNFEASPVHGFATGWFTWAELNAATNNFSSDNKISARRFGDVYRGKLVDGREVAIKRDETWSNRLSPKFNSEFLSRLHHKHLVGLVGLCEETYERHLVYEYVQNGSLYDHLHDMDSSVLSSWKMRIKIALDASLGFEYLHSNYGAGSIIIHGNVKSSNILLDATWTARVSDVGLTFMKNTVGSVGYIDPEFSPVLTEKSDVYGFGVVLLELLTGKRAIFKSAEDGCSPLSVVDLAVPVILDRDLKEILDPRVGLPNVNEAEALELVANAALNCVNMRRKYRPSIANIVLNLKQALTICDRGNPQHLSRFGGVWGAERKKEILRKTVYRKFYVIAL